MSSSLRIRLIQLVPPTGLSRGRVDYRICAVDADWTGLRLTRQSSE